MDQHRLARKHLDRRLTPLRLSEALARPPRGWVRAIRDALGMTTRQLAKRIGISQSGVVGLEKGEVQGSVSLVTLQQAAEALNCTLVYALVPNTSLEEMVRDRAQQVATDQLARIPHTIRLEDQGLAPSELAAQHERLVQELLKGAPRRLWDEP